MMSSQNWWVVTPSSFCRLFYFLVFLVFDLLLMVVLWGTNLLPPLRRRRLWMAPFQPIKWVLTHSLLVLSFFFTFWVFLVFDVLSRLLGYPPSSPLRWRRLWMAPFKINEQKISTRFGPFFEFFFPSDFAWFLFLVPFIDHIRMKFSWITSFFGQKIVS